MCSWNPLLVFTTLAGNYLSLPLVSGKEIDTCNVFSSGKMINTAFVFVKPHANTQAVRDLVQEKLSEAGIKILSERDIDGETIDKNGHIDQHYYSIASKATILPAHEIPVPPEKFLALFGETWEDVLTANKACNALEACQRFECTPEELNDAWQNAKVVKLGGGFYCSKMSLNDKPELYVFNAFFMAMRAKFVGNNSIHCYVVEWDPSILPWSAFRSKILGPTDPKDAPKGSLRHAILDSYKQLGLQSPPNQGDNGVHASASPFEGLAERVNWLGENLEEDAFGQALLEAGLPKSRIMDWFKDPQVTINDSLTTGSTFDALEDLDADACLLKLTELHGLN